MSDASGAPKSYEDFMGFLRFFPCSDASASASRASRIRACSRFETPGTARPSAPWTSRADRVLLLCYPRLLGYSFDPASVYFCYRTDGDLALLIYEVCNTLGAIHPYVLPVTSPRRGLQYRLQYRLGDRENQRLYFAPLSAHAKD